LLFFVSVVFRVLEIIVTIFWREVCVSNESRLDEAIEFCDLHLL